MRGSVQRIEERGAAAKPARDLLVRVGLYVLDVLITKAHATHRNARRTHPVPRHEDTARGKEGDAHHNPLPAYISPRGTLPASAAGTPSAAIIVLGRRSSWCKRMERGALPWTLEEEARVTPPT